MRVMAGGRHTSRQQVIRVDHERPAPLGGKLEKAVLSALEALPGAGIGPRRAGSPVRVLWLARLDSAREDPKAVLGSSLPPGRLTE